MRCVGSEAPQLFEGSLQPPEHRVQYRSKSSQLIFPILDRQPGSQILCGYFLRFAGHRVNRCQGFASQGVPSEAGKQYSKRKSNEQDSGELPELAPHRLLVVGNPKNNYGVVEMVWAAGEPDSQTVRKTLGDWDDVFPCLFPRGWSSQCLPKELGSTIEELAFRRPNLDESMQAGITLFAVMQSQS